MPITAEMIQQRKQWIGASDVAAILGLSPWKTAFDVWAEKTGKLEDSAPSESADAGNRFEPAILQWAGEQLGTLQLGALVPADGLPIAANLDAHVMATHRPVEAKTAGLFSSLSADWGEFGSDEIPSVYAIQCQVLLLCTKRDLCHVPAFLGGRGFGMFEIPRDDRLIAIIAERCEHFWTRHVQTDTPPENSACSEEVAKRLKREPGKICQLNAQAVADWRDARTARLVAEKTEDAFRAVLLACLGDAEAGDSALGRVKYGLHSRRALDQAALRENEPEICERYMRTSECRTLRLIEPKKGN